MSGADTRLLVQWTTTFTSEILVCINLIINPRSKLFLGISLTTDRGIKTFITAKVILHFHVANISHTFFPLFAQIPSAYSPKCPENDHPPPFPNGLPTPFG